MVVWQLLLLAAEFANVASYTYARAEFPANTKITILREAKPGEPMNFLMAGWNACPQGAYSILRQEIQGGIAYVNFNQRGWDPREMKNAIMHQAAQDRKAGSYQKIVVYALSCSDHVARYLEDVLNPDDQIITINPCTNVKMLRWHVRIGLYFAVPILFAITHLLLGWLSVIPIFSHVGGRASLALWTDQWFEMLFDNPPTNTEHTKAVLISTIDGLLDYLAQISLFSKNRRFLMKTDHGNTIGEADKYLRILRMLKI